MWGFALVSSKIEYFIGSRSFMFSCDLTVSLAPRPLPVREGDTVRRSSRRPKKKRMSPVIALAKASDASVASAASSCRKSANCRLLLPLRVLEKEQVIESDAESDFITKIEIELGVDLVDTFENVMLAFELENALLRSEFEQETLLEEELEEPEVAEHAEIVCMQQEVQHVHQHLTQKQKYDEYDTDEENLILADFLCYSQEEDEFQFTTEEFKEDEEGDDDVEEAEIVLTDATSKDDLDAVVVAFLQELFAEEEAKEDEIDNCRLIIESLEQLSLNVM